ncbi:clusterin-associated protein-1 [Kipferlia bialata]|uniref:Clusterin-associated protein-1 n=1 Tax=Kipferlia bialata TaxID=797122 RepID=A0A391NXE7_9EUKA|nr:clusterin-associated protein-1 [Kipferlia bialata]|eukprot:g12042.t1
MAQIAKFLLELLCPSSPLFVAYQTPEERSHFVAQVVTIATTKAHVMIVPKRLYSSGPKCVRELLKLAAPLSNALIRQPSLPSLPAMAKKAQRGGTVAEERLPSLSSSMTRLSHVAAELVGLLDSSSNLPWAIASSSSADISAQQLRKGVEGRIDQSRQDLVRLETEIRTRETEKKRIESVLEKNENQARRLQERLQTMRNVRPVFSEEFEAYETRLRDLYSKYTSLFTSLAAVNAQIKANEPAPVKKKTQTRDVYFLAQKPSHAIEGVVSDSGEESLSARSESNPSEASASESSEDESESESEVSSGGSYSYSDSETEATDSQASSGSSDDTHLGDHEDDLLPTTMESLDAHPVDMDGLGGHDEFGSFKADDYMDMGGANGFGLDGGMEDDFGY